MKRTVAKSLLTVAFAVVIFTFSGTAIAQIEEIVVTATKREESIQAVPIAMQAFGSESIKDLEMKTASDFTKYLANVFAAGDGSTQPNYFIRGVGEANFHMNGVGAVGQYLDEVSLNTPLAAGFQIYDLERIEVLRGPQNTLFGRNTTGGAVQYVTRKPSLDEETNGYVGLTLGREGQVDGDVAIGANLSDRAAIRLAGSVNTRDGLYSNTFTGGKNGEIERYAGRAQLLLAPNDAVEILANVHVGFNRGDNLRYKSIGTQDPADPASVCPLNPATWDVGTNCSDGSGFVDTADYLQVNQDMTTIADIDNVGGFLKVDWDFTNFTLTSLSAFEGNEIQRNEDSDSSANFFFTFHQEGDVDQFSQELRLKSVADGGFRWIAGLYYFTEDSFWNTSVRRSPAPAPPPGAYPPGAFTIMPTTQVSQDNDTWSVYGQGDFDVSDRLTATFGVRFVSETKEFVNTALVGDGSQYDPNQFIGAAEASANPLTVLPTLNLEDTWDEWTG